MGGCHRARGGRSLPLPDGRELIPGGASSPQKPWHQVDRNGCLADRAGLLGGNPSVCVRACVRVRVCVYVCVVCAFLSPLCLPQLSAGVKGIFHFSLISGLPRAVLGVLQPGLRGGGSPPSHKGEGDAARPPRGSAGCLRGRCFCLCFSVFLPLFHLPPVCSSVRTTGCSD